MVSIQVIRLVLFSFKYAFDINIVMWIISLFFTSMLQMLSSKDVNFMGYTYKNFEIVNDHEVPGMGI